MRNWKVKNIRIVARLSARTGATWKGHGKYSETGKLGTGNLRCRKSDFSEEQLEKLLLCLDLETAMPVGEHLISSIGRHRRTGPKHFWPRKRVATFELFSLPASSLHPVPTVPTQTNAGTVARGLSPTQSHDSVILQDAGTLRKGRVSPPIRNLSGTPTDR